MGLIHLIKSFGLTIRESANDGSDFTNPDADYRVLFLGEDGNLYVKDSAGTVTQVGGGGGGTSINQVSSLHTGNHNISSTTFVDVSASDTLDITTTGGDLFMSYQAAIGVNGGTTAHFDFTLDGSSVSGTANGIMSDAIVTVHGLYIWYVETSLAAGTYTVRPRARVGGSSVDIGQTTDLQHQLFAMELPS